MSSKFVFITLLIWAAFLVLIATFGGDSGMEAAGSAGVGTGTLIVMYGIYRLFDSL